MNFPRKWQRHEQPEPRGQSFLAEAKNAFHEMFEAHAKAAEDFPSVEDFLEELERRAWKLAEELVKKSWHNGVTRGRAGKQAPRRS